MRVRNHLSYMTFIYFYVAKRITLIQHRGILIIDQKKNPISGPGCIPCKVHAEGAPRNLCGTPKNGQLVELVILYTRKRRRI